MIDALREERELFNGKKVLDIHGHVSAPTATRAFVAMLMASNTAMKSPLSDGRPNPEMSDEEFQKSCGRHANFMSERDIDVQVIGPRPFMMLGYMADHLLP